MWSLAKHLIVKYRFLCKSNTSAQNYLRAMTNYKTAGTAKAGVRNISHTVAVKTKEAFALFNKVFQSYTPDEVFVAFNGGKDCTVVLDLLSTYFNQNENLKDSVINVLYIKPTTMFPEIEDFAAECEKNYKINMNRKEGQIKPVLHSVCNGQPNLKAVFMGLRRTDPGGVTMDHLCQTDHGWPKLMRVNPLLDWTTHDVWSYLLENKVPYCNLYDLGYTSLGDPSNTCPNANLRQINPVTGEVSYLPAYRLLDDSLERDGRR